MRYLKTFESMSTNTFEEITYIVFHQLLDNSIDFPTSEVEKINSIYNHINYHKVAMSDQRQLYLILTDQFHTKRDLYSARHRIAIQVHCLPDEWYIVHIGDDNFKCDQFDGLLDCLRYVIKKNGFESNEVSKNI